MAQGTTLDWIDTPNPAEQAFTFTAKQDISDVVPNFLETPLIWSACPAWIKQAERIPTSLQSHTLVHSEKAGFQLRRFIFCKTRTEEERSTPFHFSWIKRPFGWPTVLLKLWAEEGRIPLSAVDTGGNLLNEASKLVRQRYRPGGMFPTWFKVSHFLSERPFSRSSRQQVPITDAIHWDFDGFSGGFPECLHPGVVVPNDSTTGRVVDGFGTPSKDIGGDISQQIYPPTFPEDWQRYVLEDTRHKVMGMLMEHRVVVEAYPPNDAREEVLA